jgi:DNA polymerase III subunit epsilon
MATATTIKGAARSARKGVNDRSHLLYAVLTGVAACATWVAVTLAPRAPDWAPAAFGAGVAGFALALAWRMHSVWVMAPARRLVGMMRLIRETRKPDLSLAVAGTGLLEPLAEECTALAEALGQARRDMLAFARSEAEAAGGQRVWLESILQNLNEGVFVCNPQHRIMLYNKAAVALSDMPERIGLGRYLGDLLDIGPVRHGLSRLELRHEDDPEQLNAASAPFFCNSLDGSRVFHGRMGLLLGASGEVGGYLMTLVDATKEHALLARGDALQHALASELAPMLDEICRAADRLGEADRLTLGERDALVRLVADAGREAAETAQALSAGIDDLMVGHAIMVDIYAVDLVKLVQKNLPCRAARVTLVGTPLWVLADSLSLVEALEALLVEISDTRTVGEVFVETRPRAGGVDLDLSWKGAPVTDADLESWIDLECQGPGEHQRVRSVLDRHGSKLIACPAGPDGMGTLRIPLRTPPQRRDGAGLRRLPSRPEFYDASLMAAHQGTADLAERPLADLRFVVFDCEMTGLRPNHGDEIVQIAAVPVIRKRILSGEGIDWVVNPGRPIPPGSIRFHGLTDADVADKPSILEVLPKFHAFAGDAVLVAHNAAFDMRFITLKEKAAGVSFDNPVLDTMLISRLLDGEKGDHSLDALCERYAILNAARHTALGDTIATADLLVRMIARLETKGLASFGDVMRETNMAAELRHRSAILAHGTGTGG